MSPDVRVFVNATPVEVPSGSEVRAAIRALDPELETRAAEGTALVTDGRGIDLPLGTLLEAGAIVRVVPRARREVGSSDADA